MHETASTPIVGIATLCYLFDHKRSKVLLGAKKYGGAKGILNGFGGKVEKTDKTLTAAVAREFEEETSIFLKNPELTSVLTIINESRSISVYIFTASEWEGEAQESEEMTSEWVTLAKTQILKA